VGHREYLALCGATDNVSCVCVCAPRNVHALSLCPSPSFRLVMYVPRLVFGTKWIMITTVCSIEYSCTSRSTRTRSRKKENLGRAIHRIRVVYLVGFSHRSEEFSVCRSFKLLLAKSTKRERSMHGTCCTALARLCATIDMWAESVGIYRVTRTPQGVYFVRRQRTPIAPTPQHLATSSY
jgi:hypothetical protein